MKHLLTIMLLCALTIVKAQITLEQKDMNNLIAIGKLYSNNPNATGANFAKSINSLRTPKLSHIVDVLIAINEGDKSILETRFLSRPSDEDLILWYVIRELHYNRVNEKVTPRPDTIVLKEIISKKIDTRWLLDNYYYRINGGIATLFNTEDLSKYNIDIDNLGFKDETEKAIFFLNIMDALVGVRFKVLQMMKNNKKIIEFCDKLPMFNGKQYFYYKNFEYNDFNWIGYDKTESYNEIHIGSLYSTLIAHLNATAELRDKKEAKEIYFKSILYQPKYFKFSQSKDDLQYLYDNSN